MKSEQRKDGVIKRKWERGVDSSGPLLTPKLHVSTGRIDLMMGEGSLDIFVPLSDMATLNNLFFLIFTNIICWIGLSRNSLVKAELD